MQSTMEWPILRFFRFQTTNEKWHEIVLHDPSVLRLNEGMIITVRHGNRIVELSNVNECTYKKFLVTHMKSELQFSIDAKVSIKKWKVVFKNGSKDSESCYNIINSFIQTKLSEQQNQPKFQSNSTTSYISPSSPSLLEEREQQLAEEMNCTQLSHVVTKLVDEATNQPYKRTLKFDEDTYFDRQASRACDENSSRDCVASGPTQSANLPRTQSIANILQMNDQELREKVIACVREPQFVELVEKVHKILSEF